MNATVEDIEGDVSRRDFIYLATGAFAAVGGAVALWPFIDQMNPDASTMSLSTIEVDISPVLAGQAITVLWRGMPIFVRNLTPEEIGKAKAVDVADLKDPVARLLGSTAELPASAANITKPGKENWLIAVGICTHLGCVPKGQSPGDPRGPYGGYFCVCHGSIYDTLGRVRGGPAPRNLDIPPYEFTGEAKIKLG
ncbi:ubiquinol-cytochrome C reductase [Rhodomicrobium udaipurense JA643]|jgi:ubiquinol-cytochrome c reductase iron-sulfur subunit|uniref:Ubiquinol-cytochrome c reductase iron-sulfur subunit n=1 Tax=Rhodomicrobium udaipurense TaxID=1202716 RepID=A0A8I1GGJ4_9HYPH|nr:ubiquinol-cytochrome c reductase iron-sulfur subunit [Rhodomicrobium udaipurense]KAI94009.1 ubiquinol-cytochrome C reductase [Rhodomicrobium udaipurense JA643]MBJ7542512.1 ubiquinol-cytochrome c reductase iron-sulfur subunit [Rhodomicrobium udaipurense]